MVETQDVPKNIRSVWPQMVLAVGFVIWAQDYGCIPRLMPTLIGSATALLCGLDILSRFDNRLGRMLQLVLGADFWNRKMGHDPFLRDEVIQVCWMIFAIISMLFIGILSTVPLFVIGYMHVFGDRPVGGCRSCRG